MNRYKELLEKYKYYVIAGLTVTVIILMISLLFCLLNNQDNSGSSNGMSKQNMLYKNSSSDLTNRASSSGGNSFQKSEQKFVDVKGAVKKPGVYQFSNNMRVADAVNLADGMNNSADRKRVDLAQKLNDQQVIYIPIKGEKNSNVPSVPASAKPFSGSSSSSSGRVNINDADKNKLQSIDGVGDKRADKIIEYRKDHGNFSKIDDLKNISGIGDKFLSNIKSKITV